MNWTVTIPAETVDELHHKLAKMIDTAALEAELETRVRTAPSSGADKFAEGVTKVTKARKADEAAEKKVKPAKQEVKQPAPEPEPDFSDAGSTGDDDFGSDDGDGDTLTVEDVKNALNDFKVKHGLVTARQIMVEAGGSSKLIDIPPTNYGKLIAALTKHASH